MHSDKGCGTREKKKPGLWTLEVANFTVVVAKLGLGGFVLFFSNESFLIFYCLSFAFDIIEEDDAKLSRIFATETWFSTYISLTPVPNSFDNE